MPPERYVGKERLEELNPEVKEMMKDLFNEFFTNARKPGRFVPKRMAEMIMEKESFKTIKDEVYIYDKKDGIWKDVGTEAIKKYVREELGENGNTHDVNEVVNHIRDVTNETDVPEVDVKYIPLKNGILDWTTGRLQEYSPSFFFTQKLEVAFDEKAECPNIVEFLRAVAGEGDIDVLIEIASYCLLRAYPLQKAFIIYGTGGNGKSTFLNIIVSMLGKENVSSKTIQDLGGNRFAVYQLYKKHANIVTDAPSYKIASTSMFKAATGGDLLSAERKQIEKEVKFYNHAKIIFSANDLPPTEDDTEAYWRRIVLVHFPNKFQEAGIESKILTDGELSGFLNLCLLGLRRIMGNMKFDYAKSGEQVKAEYISNSDPIWAFSEQMIVRTGHSSDYVTKEDLYETYRNYCEKKGHDIKSKIAFFRELAKHITIKDQDIEIDERRVSVVRGIILREQPKLVEFTPKTRYYSNLLQQYESKCCTNMAEYRVSRVSMTNNDSSHSINGEDIKK